MITYQDALDLKFEESKYCNTYYGNPNFEIYLRYKDKYPPYDKYEVKSLELYSGERDEPIDISHLNKEEVELLISLLTKPKD